MHDYPSNDIRSGDDCKNLDFELVFFFFFSKKK